MPDIFRHTRSISRPATVVFLLSASMILAFGSCRREEGPAIYGNIAGLPDGGVYLSVYEGALRTIDSTGSQNGVFTLDLPQILPNMLFLQFEGYDGYYLPMMIDGSDILVHGDINYHEDIEVSGGAANELLGEYRNSVRPYNIMLRAIDTGLAGYADSTAITDSVQYGRLLFKRDSVELLIGERRRDFVRANPSDISAAILVAIQADDSLPRWRIDSLINELDTAAMRDNVFLRRLNRRLRSAK